MIRLKSKILLEDIWSEYDHMDITKDNLTIRFSGYDNFEADPYIKIYKDMNTPFQKMCRLSLISPRYLCLENETLSLNEEEIAKVISIFDSIGWESILENYLHPFYADVFADKENIDKYMEENNWKITGLNYKSFRMPYYNNLIYSSSSQDLRLRSNAHDRDINDYYEHLSYIKSNLVFENKWFRAYLYDKELFPVMAIEQKYRNKIIKYKAYINIINFSILNKDDYTKDEITYINQISNSLFKDTPNIYDIHSRFSHLNYDIHDTIILLYSARKGIKLQDIKFKDL